MKEKPDYNKIREYEKELDGMNAAAVRKKAKGGVPVVKPSVKKRVPVSERPTKVYQGDELNVTIKYKDLTMLKVPGGVEHPSVMRLQDAKGRKLISDNTFYEVLGIEGVSLSDLVTIVPNTMYSDVVGYYVVYSADGKSIDRRTINEHGVPREEKIEYLPPLDVKVLFDSHRDGTRNEPRST